MINKKPKFKLPVQIIPPLNWRANFLNKNLVTGTWAQTADVNQTIYDPLLAGNVPGVITVSPSLIYSGFSLDKVFIDVKKTYKIKMVCIKFVSAGIISIRLQSINYDLQPIEILTYDAYNATTVYNMIVNGLVKNIPSDTYVIKVLIDGTNPSSGMYYCNMSLLTIEEQLP